MNGRVGILTVIIGILFAIVCLVIIITPASPSPGTTSSRYTVIWWAVTNDRGYLELVFLGREVGSEGNYKPHQASFYFEVVTDAVDGKCILEKLSSGSDILHVPPNQGVCVS